MRSCKKCNKALSYGNKSGYCLQCWNRSEEKLTKQSETMRQKWRDPAQRKAMTETGTRNLIDTGAQKKAAMVAKARQTWKIAAQHIKPEHRERAKRAISETKIGHIPKELRPLYYDLTRLKRMSAEEATKLVLDHHEVELEKFRRKLMNA